MPARKKATPTTNGADVEKKGAVKVQEEKKQSQGKKSNKAKPGRKQAATQDKSQQQKQKETQEKAKKTKKQQQKQQKQKQKGKQQPTTTGSASRSNRKHKAKALPAPLTAQPVALGEETFIARLQEHADAENSEQLQIALLQAFARPHHESSLLKSLRKMPFTSAVTVLQESTAALELLFDASPQELSALAQSRTPPSLAYALTFVNTLVDAHLAGLLTDTTCVPLLRKLADLVHRYEALCTQLQQLDGMMYHLKREQRLQRTKGRRNARASTAAAKSTAHAQPVAYVTRTYTVEALDLS
ncbi:hypothetical protein PTSG_05254 [Salpingoeca rosetta]|uniref:Uncharacterized protein n=1 Tax=Salpingoeca rosetta (strain ATCC 50818 / BSB-021) TaxID=946362 RepID=F2U9X2_SALR5|nr:uncharacterized protein PTSG_05254 [Salpingoeca rosetta]EGD73547.1 hypothetical protein PTSG_05254 [Salpingoeca rosetta]|eukprot:XP_004993829.1 hypothetical protein PTSG_05254 [Salpingoeca rosetta]